MNFIPYVGIINNLYDTQKHITYTEIRHFYG